MRKISILIILLATITSCSDETTRDTINKTQSSMITVTEELKSHETGYETLFNKLNDSTIFELDPKFPFIGITEEEIYKYSEEVKGELSETSYESKIFPNSLISLLEKALYQIRGDGISINEEYDYYFNIMQDLFGNNFEATHEELYVRFPELNNHKDLFKDKYDVYKYISGSENCIDIFRINLNENEENYVFVYESGGSDKAVYVELTSLENSNFIKICRFYTQNWGYSRVIKYNSDYYYVFLHYNYNFKNYDAIRVHKLGDNADTETIIVKYMPKEYVWKNVYNNSEYDKSNLNDYIESIKPEIPTESVFIGDEKEDFNFGLTKEYEQYYNIDFANIGIPIYFSKTIYEPSNSFTMHLRAKFYIDNMQNNSIMELDKLEIREKPKLENELIQMWFKKLDNKVFTFRIYHISDYNYLLNVILVEGDKVTQIRNDIFSPQREFIVTSERDYSM